MRRVLGIGLGLAFASLAPAARAMTVDEIVARNIDARGGLDHLEAIKSLRLTGKERFGGGDYVVEASFASEVERPGRERVEVTYQGLTGVDAYDGAEAWRTEPWGGRHVPFRLSADETKTLVHASDLDGPLVDWRAKGNRIEYLGTEEVDGTAAHKVRVTLKDGDVETHYLDPDVFLDIRVVTVHRTRGTDEVTQTDYGDYEQVGGIWVPFSMESGRKDGPPTSRIQIEHAEANVATSDADFRFPPQGSNVARRIAEPSGAAAKTPAAPSRTPTLSATPVFDRGVVSGLGARNIGSARMSGRISAVTGYNVNGKSTLFVGAASGGVWKSTDGGTTFKPVFDKEPVQSIGAIAVDPENWKNVWVGTGEAWTRNSVSIGNGIYKSNDGGETWTHMGLPESERIVRILVHPRDSRTVYACVPGKLWSDSPDRGVYKTTDGGKSWNLVLKGSNLSTGCSGLTMDPKDPDVLFAGLWDFRRQGWTFRSGGDGPSAPSGSGMYRTADGGKTWVALTATSSKGLPSGPWGRVEVEVAPSNSQVVYVLIESSDSALYRSADGGRTWERRDNSQNVVWRPFYFGRLVVDPLVADRVFKPDLDLVVSEDGGRSFEETTGGMHGDSHDLWIDPTNPSHIVAADDGGLWISWDGGTRWWKCNNLPISQFYHVSVDDEDPYKVYGGLQDNSVWVGDSSYPGGIGNSQWENLFGGDGFWALVDPSDSRYVYVESQGGFMARVDRKTLARRDIQPTARYKEKLRFNWNTPIYASPTEKGTIYVGAQFLFRSRDRGDTWDRISPDLTTNDPSKQKQEESGGITVDNSSAEMHTTIYSISASPKDSQLLWVGTDDGNLQLSRDGGRNWRNVVGNVPGLPKGSWVSWVEASHFDAATAYAAFDRHTFGDMTPWVYKTSDYGKTWTRLVGGGQGVRGYVHVIKEDLVKPQLLFLGTELGLWISIDGGASWAEFKGSNFPSVAVRDMQEQQREGDLVIATHGRGIWIMDDLSPLRALTKDTLPHAIAFLPDRPAQQRMPAEGGWSKGDATFSGRNAPSGALITYYQRSRHIFGPLKLEVLDDTGKVVDTLHASARRGLNRVTWSMRLRPPRVPRAAQVASNATQGPRVLPGTYTVRLTNGAESVEEKLHVVVDRRAPYSVADRRANFEAEMGARQLFNDMSALVDRIDVAHSAAEDRARVLPQGDPLEGKLQNVIRKLEETKKEIVATKEGGAITGEERIREHLDTLYGAFLQWEGRPARYQLDRLSALKRELADASKAMDQIAHQDIEPIASELRSRKLDAIPTAAPQPTADNEDSAGEGEGEGSMEGAANEPAIAAALGCMLGHRAECAEAARAFANQANHEHD